MVSDPKIDVLTEKVEEIRRRGKKSLTLQIMISSIAFTTFLMAITSLTIGVINFILIRQEEAEIESLEL